jgi:hypothetical protein
MRVRTSRSLQASARASRMAKTKRMLLRAGLEGRSFQAGGGEVRRAS